MHIQTFQMRRISPEGRGLTREGAVELFHELEKELESQGVILPINSTSHAVEGEEPNGIAMVTNDQLPPAPDDEPTTTRNPRIEDDDLFSEDEIVVPPASRLSVSKPAGEGGAVSTTCRMSA